MLAPFVLMDGNGKVFPSAVQVGQACLMMVKFLAGEADLVLQGLDVMNQCMDLPVDLLLVSEIQQFSQSDQGKQGGCYG